MPPPSLPTRSPPGGSEVSWELAFSGLSCRRRLFAPCRVGRRREQAVGASADEALVVPADKCVLRVNVVQLALGPKKRRKEGKR